ncbi:MULTISPECIES: hypothetical protein [unclassified Streptomyces]|uniref:hypothetical protein n=1 Tax=unclassified Streptomyces TaxID=2593676 RepID=UPI002E2AF434|nr:hypothetical protein [Streptomyces sp. NBC_00272]
MPSAPAVQRFPSFGSGRAIGALAAAASATVSSTLEHLRASSQQAPPAEPPPPPYEPTAAHGAPPSGGRPAAVTAVSQEGPPPEYTAIPVGAFDPRDLTEFQLDELVHRIIDRVTRLVRAELRMDRERIGRLRDPRA